MRRCLITILIVASISSNAQEKVLNDKLPAKPFMMVKGDEIRRFPSSNLLDALNGLFPGVFSLSPNTNDFIFIIDGFQTADPNGISLNDIEEIIYTRSALNGNQFPYSRPGTFYITTRHSSRRKPVIEFNSQFNTTWNKRARNQFSDSYGQTVTVPLNNQSDNDNGFHAINHLSIATGSDKLKFYGGLQWDAVKTPPINQFASFGNGTPDTVTSNSTAKQNDLKAFFNLTYKINGQVDVGVTGNYFHGHSKQNIASLYNMGPGSTSTENSSAPSDLDYAHAGIFVNYRPIPGLRNTLSVEYNYVKFDYHALNTGDMILSGNPAQHNVVNISNKAKDNTTLIRDQLEYQLPLKGKFRASVGTWFSYIFGKTNWKYLYTSETGTVGGGSASSAWSKHDNKLTTLNPQFHFSVDSILYGYAGYGFLLNKGVSELTSRSKANPYGGISIDLHRAFKLKGAISSLQFTADISDLDRNLSNSYLLPEIKNGASYQSGAPVGIIIGTGPVYIPNPSLAKTLLKNKMYGVGLSAGFHENRIVAGVEWTRVEAQSISIIINNTTNPPTYFAVMGTETSTGFSTYIAASISRKVNFGWDSRLSLLLPTVRQRLDGGIQPNLYMPSKYQFQAGWQNIFRYQRLSLQLNAVMGLEKTYYTYAFQGAQPQARSFDELALNYVQLAYELPVSSSKLFDNCSVFLHGRNLLANEETKHFYQYDSFAGLGVNLRFK